jgi:hypothetical protein
MSVRISSTAIVMFSLLTMVALAQPVKEIDTSSWKVFRNQTMGFETRYPGTWHVRSVKGTGPESVMLDETPQAGKPHLAVQFWVQRHINPRGLSVQQWYGDQLRRMNSAPPPTVFTSIGGRPALRAEIAGTLGRTFQFFTALNKTDIFTTTITQPASNTQLDPTYRKLLSTIRFVN